MRRGIMSIEIIGLRNCDTCRKALKALHGAVLRDVRDDPLTGEEIAHLVAAFPGAIVNRASTTWRGLSEDERGRDAAALLAEHPALMKRPVIRAGGKTYLGWKPDVRAALGVD
jgi:arsenate reductase